MPAQAWLAPPSPVDEITRTAQTISAHELSPRLDLDLPDDELDQLARTCGVISVASVLGKGSTLSVCLPPG